MTSFVQFTPLIGANSDSHAVSYLLEVDEARILLDCGWNYTEPSSLDYLKQYSQTIDAVLISHADMYHLGGYAYAYTHLELTCPCFVTTPVHDMGLHMMRDFIKSKLDQTPWDDLTLEQVEKAFSSMVLLRYSQPYGLSGKCAGIRITAHPAGHTIGGTVWKIKKDTEDIVYAVDINHRKERHLNGTVLLNTESLTRPTLLITDAWTACSKESVATRVRDQQLIELLMGKMSQNANVLIPVESSTRVLELAHLLDHHWQERRLNYHLLFLSHEAIPVINSAKSMLEWLGDGVAQSFATRDQAFDFRFLKTYNNLKELDDIFGPKVVLTTFPSLECGYGYDLLLMWGYNPNNCILFPQVPPEKSLAYELYKSWVSEGAKPLSLVNSNYEQTVRVQKRIPLEGEELEEYLAEQEKNQEKQAPKPIQAIDADESDSDEEMGEVTGHVSYDTYVKDQTNRKGFFKQTAVRMYPVHETRFKIDDYGEVIDHSFFSKFQQKVMEEYMDLDIKLAQLKEEEETEAVPSKYVESDHMLVIKCQVSFLDFEGRSDGQSMRNIIQQVAPRKLMIVHGTPTSTQTLFDFCSQSSSITDDIFSPSEQECIQVSVAKNIYQVVLSDALVNSLRVAQLNDYSLSHVSGVIRTEETPQGPRLYLDPVPPHAERQKPTVPVGDVKLSVLNRHLVKQGFQTQFAKGGILVVNQSFVVQKGDDGLHVKGKLHPDYYKLRDIVYTFQAMIT